jgi:uncharacterized membrane protein HdeD (DUF308 family)
MTQPDQPLPDVLRARVADAVAGHWKLFLVEGLILELLGIIAFAIPLLGTIAIDFLLGGLFIIGGVVRLVPLYPTKHLPGYWWSAGAAVLAIVAGVLLLARPLEGILSITLLLMLLFLIEGVAAIVSSLDFRHHAKGWGWMLFRGVIDLVLVAIIWSGWPGSAAWAIGVLAGVNLFLMGLALVMIAIGVRSAKPAS